LILTVFNYMFKLLHCH